MTAQHPQQALYQTYWFIREEDIIPSEVAFPKWLWLIVFLGAIACIPLTFVGTFGICACVAEIHKQRHRGDVQATRRSRIFLIIECVVAILFVVLLPTIMVFELRQISM